MSDKKWMEEQWDFKKITDKPYWDYKNGFDK